MFDPNKRITGMMKDFISPGIKVLSFPFLTVKNFQKITFLRLFAVDEALCHPYLSSLHDINDEPICSRPFNFDFEHSSCTEEHIKELIWKESVKFNPDPTY